MYDIIYDFLLNNVFNSTYLASMSYSWFGTSQNLNVIFSHLVSIFAMFMFIFLLILFLRFIFRIVSGLFLLK